MAQRLNWDRVRRERIVAEHGSEPVWAGLSQPKQGKASRKKRKISATKPRSASSRKSKKKHPSGRGTLPLESTSSERKKRQKKVGSGIKPAAKLPRQQKKPTMRRDVRIVQGSRQALVVAWPERRGVVMWRTRVDASSGRQVATSGPHPQPR